MKVSEGALTPHEIKERRSEITARWLGAVLAVLLCAFLLASGVSGILRYALSDGAIRREAAKTDLGGIYVTGNAGKTSLASYLSAALSSAGRGAGITESDAEKMIREPSFADKFAALVVDAKGAAESGKGMIRGLSFVADWLGEDPEAVERICGRALSDGEIAKIREELSYDAVDFGEGSVLSDDGTLRVLLSNGFFFAFAALSAATLPAILVAGNFKARFFLSHVGVALLVSGIALSGLLLFALIKSVGAGIVASVAVSCATGVAIYAAGGAILLGIIFVLSSAISSRRRCEDEDDY